MQPVVKELRAVGGGDKQQERTSMIGYSSSSTTTLCCVWCVAETLKALVRLFLGVFGVSCCCS